MLLLLVLLITLYPACLTIQILVDRALGYPLAEALGYEDND